jgi:hypothetical protein
MRVFGLSTGPLGVPMVGYAEQLAQADTHMTERSLCST